MQLTPLSIEFVKETGSWHPCDTSVWTSSVGWPQSYFGSHEKVASTVGCIRLCEFDGGAGPVVQGASKVEKSNIRGVKTKVCG